MLKEINKKIKQITSLIFLLLIYNVSKADAADYPHFDGNNVGCESCHYVSGTQPSLMPIWTIHTPTDIDDTQYNTLCWSCHNDVDAPYVKTHSSLQTDNGYGNWTMECNICHNPHYQKQFDTYGSASYLYSGISTGITATTLTKTGAGWTVNEYQGLVAVPNIIQKRYKYKIASNTADTLTLEGPVNLTKAVVGNTFAIVYGKLINSTIVTPNSGSKTVKLFNSTGINSFADGNATYDGICEVCHTQTTYHRNTAAGDHTHNAGTGCTTCHVHTKGFKVACDVCHGYPPVVNTATGGPDGLVNNPGTTGSAKAGAHNVHVNTKGYACTMCHYNSAGSGATHNNSLTITMGYSLFSGTYQGGSYDGQAGVNYNATATTPATTVSNTGTKTCSNIYCHSTGQSTTDGASSTPAYASPVWDNPSSAACGTCHKVSEAAGLTSGSHAAHLGTTGVNGCGDCHTGAANDASSYNSSSHVNASINVSNSYTEGGAPGNGYGTCSAASCHDNGTGSLSVTPVWGTSVTDCTECHAEIPATGSHQKHVVTTNYNKAVCGDCHDSAVQGTTSPSQHLDGDLDVYDTAAGDLGYPQNVTKGGAPYDSCSTAYCHSTGQSTTNGSSATPAYATVTWGGSAACGTCHKVTEASGLTSGSHAAHLGTTGVNGCGDCHTGAADDASSYNSITHADGNIDVDNTYTADGAPGNGYGTCSTALCHDDGTGLPAVTPAWGTSVTDCSECHATVPGTGSHQKHLVTTNYKKAVCGDCHNGAVQGTTAPSQHKDGNLDVYYSSAGDLGYLQNVAKGGAPYDNCSTAYCHSTGQSTTDSSSSTPAYVTVTWGGSAACGTCHKVTEASGLTSGGHTAHLGATGVNGCGDCHAGAADNASSYDSTNHINGQINVANTYTAGGAPGNGYGTCSTASCHDDGTGNPAVTPAWGTDAPNCTQCHAATPSSGSHTVHLAVSGVACNDCHESAVQGTTAPAQHLDGNIDVYDSTSGDLGYTQNKTKGSAYSTCSTASCHSNGLGVYKITPTWGGTGTGCNMCHNALPTTGAHGAHVKTAGTAYGSTAVNNTAANVDLDCGNCHPVNSANHRNGTLEITLNKNHGGTLKSMNGATDDTSGYTRTAGTSVTCSAAYCHSQGNGAFDKTSPDWYGGSITACNVCHGNATYSDYRKATPLYTSGSPKGNAHIFHTSIQATPSNEMQCVNCHGITTATNTSIADWTRHVNGVYDVDGGGTYWDFGSIGETWYGTDTTVTIGSYDQGTKKCMNVSCHPASDTALKTWAADNYLCTDCHIIDMTSPSSYHHAMNNAGTGYPAATPQGDALTGTNPENRTCLMCHVDHNIFSPLLNTNSTSRANMLRVGIDTVPVAGDATTFTNTDFNAATGAGICISCHQQELIKDTSRRMTEPNVTRTPVITVSDYTSASHQYVVNSRYTNDGSTFNSNCTKCHDTQENEPNTFQGQYSGEPSNTNRFGVHVGPIRRLQANLGISAPSETEEEDLCYRCHSKSTDSNPGAGPAKAVANRDYYNATNMSAASQDVFTVMQSTGGRLAGPTSTTNKLYFKPSAAESPAEPMPNAHASGDTFQGGAWLGRSMSPWPTTTNYESYNQTLSVPTGTVNWRALTFTSPTVASTTTVPAGNWVVSIYARESSTSANANVRYAIYKWNSDDTQGATIIARNTHVMEFSTLSAPGSLHTMTMTLGSPVTLNAGEKLVVDIEIQTVSVSTSGSRTLSCYFGNNAAGSLQMPGSVTFNYNDPGQTGYGHNVSLYSGLHKPSNSDETLSYISANKHVECVDCHNMHAAGATRHTKGTNTASPIIKGVPGAVIQSNSTNTLYLRNTTPSEPAPNAAASTDTFQGGTWQARDMLSAQGSASQSQAVTINNTGNPRYWRMTSFVSPAVTSNTNISAGDWTLRIWAQESSTGANAYMRVTIYEWNVNDTKGTEIVAPTSYGSELTTTSTAYSWTLAGGAASLSTGDRIVVELEIDSRGATSTSYTATYRWNGSGTTNDSYVTIPAALPIGGTSGNWTAPTYTAGSATKEYEICFKCHSGANTNVASWGGTGAAGFTDVGLEFNPGNKSFHPVVAALNSSGSGSSVLQSYQLTGGWTAGQTMYCSDCHTTDSANSWGPHGSSVKWMLAGTNKAWPYDTAANNGTSTGTASSYRTLSERNTNLGTTNGLFCMNCHTVETTNNEVHKKGSSSGDKHDIACVECHLRVPHGGKVSRLISATNTASYPGNLPARYAMDGNGGRTGSLIMRKFTKTTPTNYSKNNCYATGTSSNGSSCSDHNSSSNGTESW